MTALLQTLAPDVWLVEQKHQLEVHLKTRIEQLESVSSSLKPAMAYSLLDGGKRLRAMLVFGSAKACGVQPGKVLDAAAAVEAVHAYSLVHDDLPCMDNDVLRRGKPTCHVQYGEAVALLAGDALQTAAFQWLAQAPGLNETQKIQQVLALTQAAGGAGMVDGQAIDIDSVGKALSLDALKDMHARKTGALILASVRLGFLAAESLETDKRAALESYAKVLGLAYQVIDDILDVEGSSEQLGKTSGKDAQANKPTVVSLLGLEQAKVLLADLKHEAVESCACFTSAQADVLLDLIHRITDRKS